MLDFDSTRVGEEFTAGPVRITKEKIVAFAKEYDPLPFHLDEEFGSRHRHGGLIAPGVMTFMAVWSDFIGRNLWGENMLGGSSTKIEWLHPVFAGDQVRGELRIASKQRRNRYNGMIVIVSEYYNQNDIMVITNITEMVIAGIQPGSK